MSRPKTARNVPARSAVEDIRAAVEQLRRYYPEMSASAVVIAPRGDLPNVVIPLIDNLVPNSIDADCDRWSYVGPVR